MLQRHDVVLLQITTTGIRGGGKEEISAPYQKSPDTVEYKGKSKDQKK